MTPAFLDMLRADGHHARHLDVRLDELGGPYDAILADAVLLHLDRAQFEDVLRRARAAINAGGVLAITLEEGDGAGWTVAKLGRLRHFTYWREPQLRAVLDRTGWTVTSLAHVQGAVDPWLYVLATAAHSVSWRRSLRAAPRMTAGSTSTPVQCRMPITPWLTSMPRPSSMMQPRLGVADQAGAGRVGDHVGDDHAGAQRVEIEVEPGVDVGVEADRGGVDHDVGVRGDAVGSLPAVELGLRRRLLVEQRGQLLAACWVAVDDRDRRRAGQRELDGDRPRRAAGAEQDDVGLGGSTTVRSDVRKPCAVGVLADRAGRRG